MSSPKTFLFLGATGYIGGSILSKLLQHPWASEFQITALVRDSAKAEKLARFGVTPIVGDNSKLDLLEALARDADIVISVAESTNIPATKATLSGAKTRHEATGISTIYLHTVGAIADCTVKGMHQHFTTYDDLGAAQMAAIAPEQLHRPVDLELLNADDEGHIRSYIVLPSTVYGIATGPLVECGIQKQQTTVLPWLVKASLTRGQGGMVGQGRNVWSNVELYDLADLYIVLYDAIMSDIQPAHGREGLYFAENGAHELREISAIVAQVLCEHGKGENVTPTTFTAEEEVKYFGPLAPLIGSNAKCTASRARALGWRPTNSTSALMASVRDVTTRMICGNDL